MEIRSLQPDQTDALYSYWKKIGQGIPYFFKVQPERWVDCLLQDRLDGLAQYLSSETLVAWENGSVLGFVQWGQPSLDFDANGQRVEHPHTANLRHLYFPADRPEAGQALFAAVRPGLEQFERVYAFYHILGMSCNAYHGKLSSRMPQVERLLLANGFQIRHENIYYVLDCRIFDRGPQQNLRLHPSDVDNLYGKHHFTALIKDPKIGTIEVGSAETRDLRFLTAGGTSEVVYLTWFGIQEAYQGQGMGRLLIHSLADFFAEDGLISMHTDTPKENTRARGFYEKMGFVKRDITRDYVLSRK